LVLGACVLSAKEPLYADSDAKLIFDAPDVTFTPYSLKNGQWVVEDETMVLKAEGNHYLATADKSLGQFAFVPLQGDWYIVQAGEGKKPPIYALIRNDKGELHVFVLACNAVKKLADANAHVEFVKDDCFLKPGVDHKPLFLALSANPGPDTMKLVPKS
jgi:hypothetical protein